MDLPSACLFVPLPRHSVQFSLLLLSDWFHCAAVFGNSIRGYYSWPTRENRANERLSCSYADKPPRD